MKQATPSAPPVDLATESVAGEEDPGASIDLPPSAAQPSGATPMNPADQAPPGSPATGEAVCPRCGGSGRQGPATCPDCGGTGKVTQGIGGG
ncbi:MAG TPA: hypothetical protein VLJ58_03115 [Ramlibacter sp.]|nr:hypothetical protein [Ramlibacter sp.]